LNPENPDTEDRLVFYHIDIIFVKLLQLHLFLEFLLCREFVVVYISGVVRL